MAVCILLLAVNIRKTSKHHQFGFTSIYVYQFLLSGRIFTGFVGGTGIGGCGGGSGGGGGGAAVGDQRWELVVAAGADAAAHREPVALGDFLRQRVAGRAGAGRGAGGGSGRSRSEPWKVLRVVQVGRRRRAADEARLVPVLLRRCRRCSTVR